MDPIKSETNPDGVYFRFRCFELVCGGSSRVGRHLTGTSSKEVNPVLEK